MVMVISLKMDMVISLKMDMAISFKMETIMAISRIEMDKHFKFENN